MEKNSHFSTQHLFEVHLKWNTANFQEISSSQNLQTTVTFHKPLCLQLRMSLIILHGNELKYYTNPNDTHLC